MLMYPGYEKISIPPVIENKEDEIKKDDICLDGLGLKNNTNQKKSIFSEFTKNNSDVKIIKKYKAKRKTIPQV